MKKVNYFIFLGALCFLVFTRQIEAFSSETPDCKALALRDVAAIEDHKAIILKGNYDEYITEYQFDKHTGETTFCSHGGYCYPTHLIINGKKLEALRLVHCKIEKEFSEDEDYILHSVQ